MKKISTVILVVILSLFCLMGCGTGDVPPFGSDKSQHEVTLYANGGTFLINGEESELSVSTMDKGNKERGRI